MNEFYIVSIYAISFQLAKSNSTSEIFRFSTIKAYTYSCCSLNCNIAVKWKSTSKHAISHIDIPSNTETDIHIATSIHIYGALCVFHYNFSLFCPLSFCYFVVCWMDIIWLEIKLITFSPFLRGKLPFGASGYVCVHYNTLLCI